MGNLNNNPKSKSEGHRMFRPLLTNLVPSPNSTLGLKVLTRSESREDFRRFADLTKLWTHFATLKSNRHKVVETSRCRKRTLNVIGVRAAILIVFLVQSGCASLNLFKKEEDEYSRARNAINGYSDNEGNWIRPEGSRADKSRESSLPKAFQFIPGLAPAPINRELAKSTYSEADDLFTQAAKQKEGSGERQANFRAAARKYKQAGKHWVSSALEENALYMTAESYFFAEDYPKSEDSFVKLLKERPRTRYQDMVDKRLFEIGLFWRQFDDEFYHLNLTDNRRPLNDTKRHAVRVMEKMRLNNPVGKLADDVTMELANISFKKGNWTDALDTYSDLISTYPDSPHQFDAHFFGVKAALNSYQGADYSSEPLEKAEKMIKQMTRQFREKAEGEKKQIEDAMKEVRYRRAEKEFSFATYRYNKQEARAARMHCMKILTEFGDTPFSDQAKEIMEKTGGMPAEPIQQLGWLADLFPNPNRDKYTQLIKPTPNIDEKDKETQTAYERTAGKSSSSAFNADGTTQR